MLSGRDRPPVMLPRDSPIWLEYARCNCARCQSRGDFSVSSHPRINASVNVTGMKTFDSPKLL